ncbi:MAG: hypothetical protein HYR91_02845 [Flavobacteriia bacterium]|nr:hypothetical protein [Flavobacteriia bacterium]
MKLYRLLLIGLLLTSVNSFAQEKKIGPWNVGIGFNLIDNDGLPTSQLFKMNTNWSKFPFPNTITVGYTFKEKFELEFNQSLNTFQPGTLINGVSNQTSQFFSSSAFNGKYHVNSLYKKMLWFDPFLNVGMGMTAIRKTEFFYPSVGLGANFWFGEHMGMNIQSSANFGVMSNASNYLFHVLTFKYKY